MKIAFFTDTYSPQVNGVTVFLNTFARELKKKKNKVYIFAPRIKGYRDRSQDIVRLPSLKVLSSEPEAMIPVIVPSFAYKKMLGLDVDLIHAHGNGAFSLLGLQLAKIKRVPYILTFHNDHTKYTHYVFGGRLIKPGAVAKIMKIFANLCDGVMTPSVKMERELRRYGFGGKIEVIPNFVDESLFNVRDKGFLNELFSIPKNAPILLSVGRLTKEKNYEFLIKSFAGVFKKVPNAHLVIVGKGPENDNLIKLAKKVGVLANVHFSGQIPVSEMPYVYKNASVYVHSSLSEVHSMSVLEAAASGLPFVVIKDDSYIGVIENNINGFICSQNKEEFAGAIVRLLSNKLLAKKFGANSEKIVKKNFTMKVVVRQLIAYYKKIMSDYESKRNKRKVTLSAKLPIETDRLWKIVSGVSHYPKYVKYMKSAQMNGDFNIGNTWSDRSTVFYLPFVVHHKILVIKENREVRYLITLPFGGHVMQRITMRPQGDKSRATLEAEIDFKNRFLDLVFGRILEARTREMFEGTLSRMENSINKGLVFDDAQGENDVFKYRVRNFLFPAFASLVVFAAVGVFIGFNMASEIKAAPAKVRTKVVQIRDKSIDNVRPMIDRLEDKLGRDRL